MHPSDFEEYLKLLAAMLRTSRSRKDNILRELKEHFEERLEDLEQQNISHREAVSLILGEFGDAAALAAQFHYVIQQRKRRWIMRSAISAIGAAIVTVFLALSYWPSTGGLTANVATAGNSASLSEESVLPNQESASDNLTLRKLAKPINVEFAETPLVKCMDYFAESVDVQYYINRKSLGDVGAGTETPVTIHLLKDIPADVALDLILHELGLVYTVENDIVIVSTPEELENDLKIRVYNPDVYGIECASIDNLVELIRNIAAPTSWDKVGGPGAITTLGNLLVIRQTFQAHRKIEDLLVKLGEAKKKGTVKNKG